jgi:hypothetical protein
MYFAQEQLFCGCIKQESVSAMNNKCVMQEESAPIIFCNELECSVNCERADAAAASIHCFVTNGATVGEYRMCDVPLFQQSVSSLMLLLWDFSPETQQKI